MANPLPLSKLDVALSVKPEQPNQQQDTIALSFTNLSYEVVATNTGKTKKGERLQVLSGVSGMVAPGELLAILGPSGGGKTSLLNLLAGREAPHSRVGGSIAYNGRKREKGMKRRIAFVLQDYFIFIAQFAQCSMLTPFATSLFLFPSSFLVEKRAQNFRVDHQAKNLDRRTPFLSFLHGVLPARTFRRRRPFSDRFAQSSPVSGSPVRGTQPPLHPHIAQGIPQNELAP
jgi:hypothetical protein